MTQLFLGVALVWLVKLIAVLEPGVASETELARVERDDVAVEETLGLTLDEGKRLGGRPGRDRPDSGLHHG
jgi:hypothetical protein